MAPALPFAPKLVALVEARIRVQDINSQKAAETTLTSQGRWRRCARRLEANAATVRR